MNKYEHIPRLDRNLIKEKCKNGTVSERKCFANWPNFPCYNSKTLSCESTDGTILFDPISDYIYIFSETLLSMGKLLMGSLAKLPDIEKKKQEEKLIRYFAENVTKLVPLPKLISSLKTIQDINNQNTEQNRKKVIDTLRQIKSKTQDFFGGSKYDYITDPNSAEKFSLYSIQGKNILKNYI